MGQSVVTTPGRRWESLFRKYIMISTITLHIKRSLGGELWITDYSKVRLRKRACKDLKTTLSHTNGLLKDNTVIIGPYYNQITLVHSGWFLKILKSF